MDDQTLEKVIDRMPVYGSSNRLIGTVGDIVDREFHDQVVHDIEKQYQDQSETDTL